MDYTDILTQTWIYWQHKPIWPKVNIHVCSFQKTFLADKVKSLVRQHEGDYTKNIMPKGLLAHMLTLTKASAESFTILIYTITIKFGTGFAHRVYCWGSIWLSMLFGQ